MEVVRQCQRAALQCQKLENKRLEILQTAADEMHRFTNHIRFLRKTKSTEWHLWTKQMKLKMDRFSLRAIDLNYDPKPYAVAPGNDEIRTFNSYNKLIAKHDALSNSNRLLIGSLSAEMSRLQQIAKSLTFDIEQKIASRSRSRSEQIASAFLTVHCRLNGLNISVLFD